MTRRDMDFLRQAHIKPEEIEAPRGMEDPQPSKPEKATRYDLDVYYVELDGRAVRMILLPQVVQLIDLIETQRQRAAKWQDHAQTLFGWLCGFVVLCGGLVVRLVWFS